GGRQGRHLAYAANVGQFGLEIAEARFGLQTLRQIANEAGEDSSLTKPRLTDQKFDREGISIASPGVRQPADSYDLALAGPQVGQKIAVVTLAIRRGHEQVHVLAENLRLCVAEDLFRRGAERKNLRVLVDNDHRIGNRRKDRAQMRLGILAGPRKRIARVAHLIALQPFTGMNEMLHAKRLESSRIHAAVRSNSGSGARSQKRRIAL